MKHAVIYVPGLGDHRSHMQRRVIGLWRLYGVHAEAVLMNWQEPEPFDTKLARLLRRIDELAASGYIVSLVGVSAGASATVNAFAVRQDTVRHVVCICGMLRPADTTSRRSSGFGGSLELLGASLADLPNRARHRILSIRPLNDEIVSPSDTVIPGAHAKIIPTAGHALSIGLGITLFSPLVIWFIRRD